MNKPTPSLPPLEWVRAFEAAARLGSFTAAAEETGLTQPAISQRISQLEKLLGTQLFLRQSRTITLTVEGETWLPHVQSAFRTLSDSSEMLFSRGRSRLTILASQSVISMWLAPRLAQMTVATGAQISLQSFVLTGQTSTPDSSLQIRYGAGDWPHHYKLPLFREALAPVCAPSLASTNWHHLPRIACTGPRPDWDVFAARFGIPSTPIPQIRIDTLHGAIAAAKAGHGIALGSLPLCEEDLRSGALQQLGNDVMEHRETYWLLASREAIGRKQWEALSEAIVSAV
ncbi:LysR family transcriptional regulator [Shimia sp. R9_3]|uniref:LysR family transcriptional regulator n=1 Tax=Shimia sp. R9_3 TaxID=2821113 RepID=UPI001ADAD967|nr:LysR family transcriptional regulator [Shimia sp. R9_3]MBO9402545.1 LysR family transcriptional regulator [Shimia sp. R9_3]